MYVCRSNPCEQQAQVALNAPLATVFFFYFWDELTSTGDGFLYVIICSERKCCSVCWPAALVRSLLLSANIMVAVSACTKDL